MAGPISLPPQGNASLPPISSFTSSHHHQWNISPRQRGDSRDSGNWSFSQSKHSSGTSSNSGIHIRSILNDEESPSTYQCQQTPCLPFLNKALDHHPNTDNSSHLESRRSSVESRVNTDMGQLVISSPFESRNSSCLSIVSGLHQMRGINTDSRTVGTSPMSPLFPGTIRSHPTPRRAPVISPNPRSVSGMPDPTAAYPTKGFPWAYPDPDDRRTSSSGASSMARSVPSRQSSFTKSVNGGVCGTDTVLPPGQIRFQDDVSSHHSIQHRSIMNLQENDQSHAGGNYSRTPELRVSHKMAERKRRNEMKLLFAELNGILPNSPGNRSSKWEILTKSIEYIRNLCRAHEAVRVENARLRPDAVTCRQIQKENDMLRNELHATWQQLQQVDPDNTHIYGSTTSMFARQHSQPVLLGGYLETPEHVMGLKPDP